MAIFQERPTAVKEGMRQVFAGTHEPRTHTLVDQKPDKNSEMKRPARPLREAVVGNALYKDVIHTTGDGPSIIR